MRELAIRYKTVIQNLSYLSVMQICIVVIPLFTIPYLIKVLGKETYGLVIYSQIFLGYIQIIVNFGFSSFALREVSINRDDKTKLSEIITSIFIIKSTLLILSLFILAVVIHLSPVANEHKMLFLLSFLVCLSDVINPMWYFQGVEKMKYITYLTLVSRTIFFVLVFVIITKPEHYLRFPIINGIGAFFSGVLAMIVLYNKENIRMKMPSFTIISSYFLNSISFFVADFSVNLFANANKLIIGSYLGLTELAYYDIAEKITSIFKGVPLTIVRNSIFPFVAKTKKINLVKKTTTIMSIYAIFMICIINMFAPSFIVLIGGKEMLPSIDILRILSITILTTTLSNYYITVGLWSLGHDVVYRNLMIFASLLNLIIYAVFVIFKVMNLYTVTYAVLIIDIYLIIHVHIYFQSINLSQISWKKLKIF